MGKARRTRQTVGDFLVASCRRLSRGRPARRVGPERPHARRAGAVAAASGASCLDGVKKVLTAERVTCVPCLGAARRAVRADLRRLIRSPRRVSVVKIGR
jgi:hypothetical protein